MKVGPRPAVDSKTKVCSLSSYPHVFSLDGLKTKTKTAEFFQDFLLAPNHLRFVSTSEKKVNCPDENVEVQKDASVGRGVTA